MIIIDLVQGEKIRIGDYVIVGIARVDCGKTRIGVDAPREMKVLRGELLRRKNGTNTQTELQKE